MHSQTLQALRSEIEAVATMQSALQRIGRQVDEKQVRVWHGPGPEDVTEYADDDGSFSREAVEDLRLRAAQALAERYREVSALVDQGNGHAEQLRSVLHSAMTVGTGVAEAADPAHTLEELTRDGALRLERAVEAANFVKHQLETPEEVAASKKPTVKARAVKAPAKVVKPAGKAKKTKAAVAKKKPALKAAAKAKAKAKTKPAAKSKRRAAKKPAKAAKRR